MKGERKKTIRWLKGAQENSTTAREVKISLPKAPWELQPKGSSGDEDQE